MSSRIQKEIEAVDAISKLNQREGQIVCPLCGGNMPFKENKKSVLEAKCETSKCIWILSIPFGKLIKPQ